jgi:hypothetical protein
MSDYPLTRLLRPSLLPETAAWATALASAGWTTSEIIVTGGTLAPATTAVLAGALVAQTRRLDRRATEVGGR